MTISTETRIAGPYSGTGLVSTYSFSFKVFSVSDLVVTSTVSGIDTVLVYGSGYTVALNSDQDANPGGTITYCVAAVPTVLPVGTNLTITTSIPYTQTTELTNGGGWYPKVIEYALDRLVAIVQQLKNIGDRALRLPLTVTGVSTQLPVPSAGKLIGWDSLGTSIENKDPSSIAAGVVYGTGKADLFSGNGVTTSFTLSANPGARANLDVAISGITQRPGIDFDWTTGTTLTFTTAPPVGTNNVFARYVQAITAVNALQISANLSDLQDKTISRANLSAAASGANTDITSLNAPALGSATATKQALSDYSTKLVTTNWASDYLNFKSSVRQTVQYGPIDVNGFASFGGATGSTTVTATGFIWATAAATVDSNCTGNITNPSWTGLNTNGTMYLYLNISPDGVVATGSTTLAPVYQWGGAYSTVNGQHTFNIQEMTMKVGNGSTTAQVYRVFVGEVTVSGGVVSAITWYAINGRYRSPPLSAWPAVNTLTNFAHNIGISTGLRARAASRWSASTTVGSVTFAVGDETELCQLYTSGSYWTGTPPVPNLGRLNAGLANSSGGLGFSTGSTGFTGVYLGVGTASESNSKPFVEVWRSW